MTVVALAIEADVQRNALTQRHTDLNDEFYQRIKERRADNGDEARLRATIARLRKAIASKDKGLAQFRADVPALVRAVHQLTMENQQLRDMHSGAASFLSPGGCPSGLRSRSPRNAEPGHLRCHRACRDA